jgi:DNA-binding transcriptional LysR family regulator
MPRAPRPRPLLDAHLSDLRAYTLVVDHGSMTAAARVLGEAKSSVSRRVTRLERAVGVQLLRRTPRSVTPTDEGLVFRERVGQGLALLDDALSATEPEGSLTGNIRVTMPADFALLLARDLAHFASDHPGLKLDLVLSTRRLDLHAEQIDVAVRMAGGLESSALIVRKAFELEFGLFASPSYLAKHGAVRSLLDLARHRVMGFRVRPHEPMTLASVEGPDKIEVARCILASDGNVLRESAIAGAGIGLIPRIFVEEPLARGELVSVLDGRVLFPRIGVHVLQAPKRITPRRVRAFLAFLEATLRPPGLATRRSR